MDNAIDIKSHTAEEVAALWDDEAKGAVERESKHLQGFFRLMQEAPDHLAMIVKRPTAKEKKSLPNGKPTLVNLLIQKGLAETTAEKMFSNMIRFREAYQQFQYVPPTKTPDGQVMYWDKAYSQVTELLGIKRKETRKQNIEQKDMAIEGSYIATENAKLARDAKGRIIATPEEVAEATQKAYARMDEEKRMSKVSKAASEAWKAVGPELIPALVKALNDLFADYTTRKSQEPAKATQEAVKQPETAPEAAKVNAPAPEASNEQQQQGFKQSA